MSDVSKRFEQIVIKTHKKFIDEGRLYPEKTPEGILVGDILITCDGPYKHIIKNQETIYADICLNDAAIKIANLLALGKSTQDCNRIFNADREYNRLYVERAMLLAAYHSSLESRDYFKAEVLWARYCEIKTKAVTAKKKAQRLAAFL